MTVMTMKIELAELEKHEAWLRLSNIMKAGDKHIRLERKLIKNWREAYDTVLKELVRQIL